MSSRDKGLSKAEKRWQRQVREADARRQAYGSMLEATDNDETPEAREALERFGRKVESESKLGAAVVVTDLVEKRYGVKLSGALMQVCEPLLAEAGDDPGAIRKAVGFGVIGWNKACMPDAPMDDLVSKLAASTGDTPSQKKMIGMLREVIDDMAERKQKLYPDINMLIMNYEVVLNGGDLQVNVAGAELSAKKGALPRKGLLGRLRGLIPRLAVRQ